MSATVTSLCVGSVHATDQRPKLPRATTLCERPPGSRRVAAHAQSPPWRRPAQPSSTRHSPDAPRLALSRVRRAVRGVPLVGRHALAEWAERTETGLLEMPGDPSAQRRAGDGDDDGARYCLRLLLDVDDEDAAIHCDATLPNVRLPGFVDCGVFGSGLNGVRHGRAAMHAPLGLCGDRPGLHLHVTHNDRLEQECQAM